MSKLRKTFTKMLTMVISAKGDLWVSLFLCIHLFSLAVTLVPTLFSIFQTLQGISQGGTTSITLKQSLSTIIMPNFSGSLGTRRFWGPAQGLGWSAGAPWTCILNSSSFHFNLLRPRATLGGPWHWLTAPLASSTRLKWVTIVEIHLNGCWCQNLVILYNCTHICVLHIIDCVCNFRA